MISEKLKKNDYTWIDVEDPQANDFQQLSTDFNLPYLLIQDTLRPEHLPKYEESDEGHFLMMRSYDEECSEDDSTIQGLTRKIALYINDNKLVTIHRVHLRLLDTVAEKVRKNEHPKTIHGLIHLIILGVIRSYETPMASLQETYDELEHDILIKKHERLELNRIYHFRRRLFLLKRILKQINDSLLKFKDFWNDQPSMLQDLKENIDQLYFQMDEISDSFDHLFQLHVSLNDQRANEVMKILTIFSTILLPLNFIASFYGMNFIHLPGLESKHAFATVSLIMLIIILGAVWYFRRMKWFATPRE